MNVSSSKVNDLLKCSYAFYAKNILNLPDIPHPKTLQGSCVHDLVEYLLKPKKRRRIFLSQIIKDGYNFDLHPSGRRFCRQFAYHHKLSNFPIDDIEKMVRLAIRTISHHILTKKWYSEQRFEMAIGRAICSGYIDFLCHGSTLGEGRIIDFKTKGQRFTKQELPNNIQAIIYQLYFYEKYGELVPVDFVMLRFPPTNRNSTYHIQTVNPPTLDQLEGLRIYIDELHETINNFTTEKAYSSFCEDKFFCQKVCQFREPFKYNSLMNISDNSLVGNYLPKDTPTPSDDQYVEGREYLGCPKFN